MKLPDITPAQLVALAKVLLALAASFGLELSGHQTESILALVGLVAPAIALILADAHIRNGRSRIYSTAEGAASAEHIKPAVPR